METSTHKTINHLFSFQKRVIRIIKVSVLSTKLPYFEHSRTIGDLYIIYRYFLKLCSNELFSTIPSCVTSLRQTKTLNNSHILTVSLDEHRNFLFVTSLYSKHIDSGFVGITAFPFFTESSVLQFLF